MIYEKILETMGLPFTVIYGLLFLGFFYFIFVSVPKTLKTKSWPTTIARIKSNKLKTSNRFNNQGAKSIMYSADIEYVYEVNSNEYLSKKIKLTDHRSNNKNYHQKLLEKYELGKEVMVFYNPKKPSIAVLEPGLGTGSFVAALFFLVSLGTMTFVLLGKL